MVPLKAPDEPTFFQTSPVAFQMCSPPMETHCSSAFTTTFVSMSSVTTAGDSESV